MITFEMWSGDKVTGSVTVPAPKRLRHRLMLRFAAFLWTRVADAENR